MRDQAPGEPSDAQPKSTKGCAIMLVIGLLLGLGLLGWFFLWGQAIPEGEESNSKDSANAAITLSFRQPV